ncbi:Hypothetical protein A7982_03384 [Minicystis rosea]|nr:Hypothetical protein A7982_03384 [Minicystis rosea]
MIRYDIAGALTLSIAMSGAALTACGGAQDRPEPPSGAVDPGVHGLASANDTARSAPRSAAPSDVGAGSMGSIAGSLPGVLPGGLPGLSPSAPAAQPNAAPATGEATGKITMTREHCETLGRKFGELAMAQAPGGGSAMEREASSVSRTFADRCAHDMVGQAVEAAEYQCMLRAPSADALLGCKR